MSSIPQHHGPSPYQRLIALVHSERKDLAVILIYSVAIGVLSLAAPIAVQSLVNTVAFGTVLQPLFVLTVLLAAALLASAALQCLRAVAVEIVQRRVFVRLSAQIADVLLRVQAAAFDRQHGPELVNRFLDVVTVQKSFAVLLIDGLTVTMQTVIGLFLLALYHPYLLAFDAFLLISMLLILFVGGLGSVRTAIAESRGKYDVLAWLEEMAAHQAAFRSAPGTAYALGRTNQLVSGWLAARSAHFRILLRQLAGSLGLQAIAMASLLGAGGWLVVNGELTLGQLVAAELVVSLIVSGFAKFGKSLESFYDLQAALDKLGHLVDLPVEAAPQQKAEIRTGPAAIAGHEVSFSWEGERPLLSGVHLSIAPASRVAVLARGGKGKSTLLELVGGLRGCTSGVLELNGLDYRDCSLAGVRDHVVLVRDIEIFPGTLLENVRLGSGASVSEVRESLVHAGLGDVLLSLPEGLNTKLTTGGQPLSHSQALRVMLARAFVRRPGVLLLDEVIDHLEDFDPNGSLAATLFGPERPWTLIVTTEDKEVASHFERVFSISEGRLVDGLPEELHAVSVQEGRK